MGGSGSRGARDYNILHAPLLWRYRFIIYLINTPLRLAVPVHHLVNPKKLETGLRTISAGIPCALLLRIEAFEFPTFGLLLL